MAAVGEFVYVEKIDGASQPKQYASSTAFRYNGAGGWTMSGAGGLSLYLDGDSSTAANMVIMTNGGGTAYFGQENSAGSAFSANPYAMVAVIPASRTLDVVQLGYGMVARFSSTGHTLKRSGDGVVATFTGGSQSGYFYSSATEFWMGGDASIAHGFGVNHASAYLSLWNAGESARFTSTTAELKRNTYITNANAIFSIQSTTGTNEVQMRFVNSAGISYVGVENSVSSWFLASPYALVLRTASTSYNLEFFHGSTRAGIISSVGWLIQAGTKNALRLIPLADAAGFDISATDSTGSIAYKPIAISGTSFTAYETGGGKRLLINTSGADFNCNVTISTSHVLGYTTGAGGTVTQATSKATGVTLSKPSGRITMHNATLNTVTSVSFTLTNTLITAVDHLIVTHVSAGTLGVYGITANCAAGSATITVRNNHSANLSEAIVLKFSLIRGSNT